MPARRHRFRRPIGWVRHSRIRTTSDAGRPASAVGETMATKFTPERSEQIRNLVERGNSREEIADLIGVSVGSLQVTCSRLGVSLRRPIFNTGTGLLRRVAPGPKGTANHHADASKGVIE